MLIISIAGRLDLVAMLRLENMSALLPGHTWKYII